MYYGLFHHTWHQHTKLHCTQYPKETLLGTGLSHEQFRAIDIRFLTKVRNCTVIFTSKRSVRTVGKITSALVYIPNINLHTLHMLTCTLFHIDMSICMFAFHRSRQAVRQTQAVRKSHASRQKFYLDHWSSCKFSLKCMSRAEHSSKNGGPHPPSPRRLLGALVISDE